MYNNKRLFVFFVVIALVTTACSLTSLVGQNNPSGETGQLAEENSMENTVAGDEEPSSENEQATSTPEAGQAFENPAPAGLEVVADNKAFVVTGAIRPANDIITEANRFNAVPEAGEEYLLVEFQIRCVKSQDEQCSFSPFNMLVYGSLEERHTRAFAAGLENEHESIDFNGGETVSGVMPFLVGQDETDLILIYQPFSGGAYFFTVPTQ